jgi:hypothetical protein
MSDAFPNPFANAEAARAHVRAQVAQAQMRADAVNVLADTVAVTTAKVRSPNGEIVVTATAGAAISDVKFSESAYALQPDALGRLVTKTILAAQRAAAEVAIAATEESLGADSSFVIALRAEVDSRFGPESKQL